MANEDIFKYNPISEWNGDYVDFGMPSTDGDIRLTEICLAAESCLEATKNAMDLSFSSPGFAKARTAPVLNIVRTLFGEETGININTFQSVGDDGSIHFMSPMVSAAMELLGYDWVYEIVNNNMALSLDPIYYDTWTDPYDEKPIRTYTRRETHAINPLSSSANASTVVTTGNRPVTGNWDTDGEPYWEINWDSASTGRCSDNVQTTQPACEGIVLGGYCREGFGTGRGYCSNSSYRNNETSCLSYGTCSDPTYNDNESGCVGNSNIWLPSYTWSSSEGTPPRAIKKDNGTCDNSAYDGNESSCPSGQWHAVGFVEANIDYYGSGHCLGTAGSGAPFTNGKCFYQNGSNSDTQAWAPYGSTEAWCLDYAANRDIWSHLWWTWIPPQNDWTVINAVWRPTTGADYGSYPHFKNWNIKTSNNHRKWPEYHVTPIWEMMGSTYRIYHSDINSSWGNGEEVGRSTIPLWVTSTYDWPDNDHTYDYCYDPGSNPQTQWSSPAGYIDDVACLAAGTCTGDRNPGNYHNNQVDCETAEGNNGYICSGGGWTDQSACVNASYCSGGSHTSQSACVNSGYTWYDCSAGGWTNSTACTSAGECYYHIWSNHAYLSQFNNNPQACWAQNYGVGYPHYHYYGYTWDSHWTNHGYTWNNYNYSWYQANTFTSENNTWDSIIPDVEVEIPITPEYLWKPMFPPHTFVDTTDSRVLDEQGYTSSGYPASELHASQSQIRWRPPQRTSDDYNRTYPRPTKFRIYRAPAYYLGYQAVTDYTEEIWKLAGEVTTKSDDGYHYFYDTREDMVNEGLMEYQYAWYAITAVWEDWNWKRGYTINLYDNMGCQDWDVYHGQTWSAYSGNTRLEGLCSNNSYTTQASCAGGGTCYGNSAYNNNETLCLSFGTCSDPTYDNDEAGCIGVAGTWTTFYVWSSGNYTWTPGTWSGTPNSNANLNDVENASPAAGYPQNMKAVRFTTLGNYKTYRASGYFKAPVSGEYQFQVGGDDGLFLWLGADQQSVSGLIGTRNDGNYLAAVPGLHGVVYHTGTISLVKDGIYPLLAYGGNHTGGFAFQIRIHYPDGEWNNGGNGSGEWKYVPILMGPEDMVLEDGGGQTVEGHWAATSVSAWYTHFP